MSQSDGSLYVSEAKVQPRSVWGRYARLRVLAMIVLLGLFYLLPWIRIGGEPAVLFDLAARRFHIFGLTFVPQDLFLMSWLLALAAMTLFLFTTLAGRLWCGYACPQTVWTEAFLWIEQAFEGDRHQRLRLDKKPWGVEKLLRRGGRHVAWIVFAGFTGVTFVAYFVPATELAPALATGDAGFWPYFWTAFYAVATWGNAGFLREQVCKYMCPYARFQSAMFDDRTLIIAYDERRGEPRKADAKLQDLPPGDCVSCTMCVQVCPTGIDIRDGLQYECIACAACIDACNEVMDAVDKPRGLIKYTSTHHERSGRFDLLRPRMIGYAAVWLLLTAGLVIALLTRGDYTLDVIRDRTQMQRTLADGRVQNVYTIKVTNKLDQRRDYTLRVTDGPNALLVAPDDVSVAPGATRALIVNVTRDPPESPVSTITFHLSPVDAESAATRESTFLSVAP